MLINSCTAYKKKALDINQRRNQERKGQKRVSIRNQQMIGKNIKDKCLVYQVGNSTITFYKSAPATTINFFI
jgi:hypothetical protein